MHQLSRRQVRRLALARAGLLKPRWTGLPRRAAGGGRRARQAAHRIVQRFGYLQLDTISVAGARSHVLVLLSRLEGFDPRLGEQLLEPGEPLFEYWGHETSWLPLELYPTFEFRRNDFRVHPWWGDVLAEHPRLAERLMRQIRDEGPLRSTDLEGESGTGMWEIKAAKKVASALWSRGDLAIRSRRNFQRQFDLTERVVPAETLARREERPAALRTLLLRALAGHGWAQTGTLVATWRPQKMRAELTAALDELVAAGEVVACDLMTGRRRLAGWIRPQDLELADRLERVRPRRDRGVLLSPFDPALWDRARVELLFDFHQVLEIYKPRGKRIYGYFCLPVLAGERLVARIDLKADRRRGRLHPLSCHYESEPPSSADRQAARAALLRYADSLGLATTAAV